MAVECSQLSNQLQVLTTPRGKLPARSSLVSAVSTHSAYWFCSLLAECLLRHRLCQLVPYAACCLSRSAQEKATVRPARCPRLLTYVSNLLANPRSLGTLPHGHLARGLSRRPHPTLLMALLLERQTAMCLPLTRCGLTCGPFLSLILGGGVLSSFLSLRMKMRPGRSGLSTECAVGCGTAPRVICTR